LLNRPGNRSFLLHIHSSVAPFEVSSHNLLAH
jgi:hypothetical protein